MFSMIIKKLTGFDPAAILIAIFLALIAVIAIPNYERILGVFGYETRAVLKEKLNVANNNVTIAADVNKINQINTNIIEHNSAISEDAIVQKVKEDKLILKSSTEIKVKKEKVIKVIYDNPTKTDADKDKEISEVQISSIWDAYCQGNQNEGCSTNKTGSS